MARSEITAIGLVAVDLAAGYPRREYLSPRQEAGTT